MHINKKISALTTAILLVVVLVALPLFDSAPLAYATNDTTILNFKEKTASISIWNLNGSLETAAQLFVDTGYNEKCLTVSQWNRYTGQVYTQFSQCNPLQTGEFAMPSSLSSASFTGNITGTDFLTKMAKTITVNAQWNGTGDTNRYTTASHNEYGDVTINVHSVGWSRVATAFIQLGGDLSYNGPVEYASLGDFKMGRMEISAS